MRISDSRPLRSRRCLPTKIADLQIRPVESRFVTLDISTLSFPAQHWIEGFTVPKILVCGVPFRDACGKDAKLDLELAASDGFPQRNSRVKEGHSKESNWVEDRGRGGEARTQPTR
jgi:hypothetical protein